VVVDEAAVADRTIEHFDLGTIHGLPFRIRRSAIGREIRNSKLEIRNKSKIQSTNDRNAVSGSAPF
jgi:hypothetical protein